MPQQHPVKSHCLREQTRHNELEAACNAIKRLQGTHLMGVQSGCMADAPTLRTMLLYRGRRQSIGQVRTTSSITCIVTNIGHKQPALCGVPGQVDKHAHRIDMLQQSWTCLKQPPLEAFILWLSLLAAVTDGCCNRLHMLYHCKLHCT